jgi:protein TIF31
MHSFSLRMLLSEANSAGEKKISNLLQNHRQEELIAAQSFVENLLKESLQKLEEENTEKQSFMRWELGACWVQHLQDQKNSDKDKKQGGEKEKKKTADKSLKETKVEGLGKPLKALKNSKNSVDTADKNLSEGTSLLESQKYKPSDVELPHGESSASENESLLKNLLPEAAFTRLKESETGLHQKVEMHTIYRIDPIAMLLFAVLVNEMFVKINLSFILIHIIGNYTCYV